MPISVSVDEVRRLISISIEGTIGEADLRALGARVRGDPAFAAGYPILYDCTGAAAILASGEFVYNMGANARADKNRIAFVATSPTAFGLARMYQIVADESGKRIQVFATPEEALGWLG